jgi:hypothetical protein
MKETFLQWFPSLNKKKKYFCDAYDRGLQTSYRQISIEIRFGVPKVAGPDCGKRTRLYDDQR